MPKTHYHSSGKFKVVPLVIATILASIACIGAATVYSIVGEPGVFSGGNICGMIILDIWIFSMFYLFKRYNHSRNMTINIVTGLCICGACWWYSGARWEGLALLIPVSMLCMMDYYCEKCRRYYSKKTSYIVDAENFLSHANRYPDYSFLPDMNFYDQPLREFDPSEKLIKVDYYYCLSCESKPLANIYLCVWEKHHKHSRHHHHKQSMLDMVLDGKREGNYHWVIQEKHPIVEGIYLDNKTGRKLSLLLGY